MHDDTELHEIPTSARRQAETVRPDLLGHREDAAVSNERYTYNRGDVQRDELIRNTITYCFRFLIIVGAFAVGLLMIALALATVAVIWTAVSPVEWSIVPEAKMTVLIQGFREELPNVSFVTGSSLALIIVALIRWWNRSQD